MAVTANAGLLAQRLAQRLPQANAHVLHRVMLVHLQVAGGLDGQIHGGVLGQQRQHVVEKADAGGDLRFADAVERQFATRSRFRPFCGGCGRCGAWGKGIIGRDQGRSGPGASLVRFYTIAFSFSRQASISASVPTLIRNPSPQPG